MAAKGWRLEGDMEARLNQFGPNVKRGMVAAANYVAPLAEAHMKSTAPWTDRTGAARNGLGTQVLVSPNAVAIVLYHTVPYGIYLETRWGGKFAVIEPTILVMAPVFVKAIGRLAFKNGAG